MEYPAEIALTETIKSPDDDDNDEDALRRYDVLPCGNKTIAFLVSSNY